MSADDADVLARAKQGDSRAFAALVKKHQRRVYATAYHILGNHSDADDVTQETFLRAHRGLASFAGKSGLSTWLYRICVNTALNHLRKHKRAAALWDAEPAADADQARATPDPREWTLLGERMRAVLAALFALSESLRITLVLATVEGRPHREIAELLGIPEGTVAWRVNEARRQLRERLGGSEEAQ
jgi:RNA polymerase sigma-70 factor (ECF subfamily)